MPLQQQKPTSPGRRFQVKVQSPQLHKGDPHSALLAPLSKTGGRNNKGRITTRHKGGGHKRHYRVIDFKRNKDGVPGKVERIEYDPNRSAHLALILYADGERRYILAPKNCRTGDPIISGKDAPIKPGNALPIRNIPVGTLVHNIELKPARVASSCVPPAVRPSWPRAKVPTQPSACARARCARCTSTAAPPLARSVTTNTTCASSARPVRSVGRVCARRFAALP